MLIRFSKVRRTIKTLVFSKRTLGARRSLGASGDSWKDPRIPEEQLQIVDKQLDMLRSGNPPSVYAVGVEALNAIPGSNTLTLLEVGCASGYYSEVISTLVGERFEYTGSDYSDAMLTVARERYPDTKFLRLDIRHIDLPDRSHDVVLSGAVVEHVEEWEKAVRELARVARAYLVLHRTPVTRGKFHRIEKEGHAGVPLFFNTFSKNQLMNLISECGFIRIFEGNVYSYEQKGFGHMTYVFERLD